MFCSNCGKKIEDNKRYCTNCGNEVQGLDIITKVQMETKLVSATCTSCGAGVQVNPDNEIAECPYCGSSYIVEKAINKFNVANANFCIENAAINVVMGVESDKQRKRDSLFAMAGQVIIEKQKGSTGLLQRTFKIDFIRASEIMMQLEEAGIVGPQNGIQRKVLMNSKEFNAFLKANNYV